MTEISKRLAEIELGRKIAEARSAETTRLQEAWRQKKAEEYAEEQRRSDEVYKLANTYVVTAQPIAAEPLLVTTEPPSVPLPPPIETDITTRRSAKVKS
jgi:hypothetical protein